jgi:tetratricopeptide (TPR) repeat protein
MKDGSRFVFPEIKLSAGRAMKPIKWIAVALLAFVSVRAQAQSDLTPQSATAARSNQPQPDFAKARELLQQGKYDEAISQLQATAAKSPGLKGLDSELGTAYYQKGDYIKAIDSLKRALAEDPENKEAIQLVGLSYYLSGRPGDAIPPLEKVQAWYPRANVDASYILGLCYIQTKDYSQAQKAFARMFEVPADSAASYLFTARMLLRQEFDPIAEEYGQKAITLDPKLPLAHFFLGELHLYKSRIPEAIRDFQQELALNPAHAPTYYKLADAYSRIQKFDDAERLLQRSIWLDATSTGPYILMGKILAKKGETELAVRALKHALGMDPNNSVTHHLLGQAYRNMGRNEDAERELKTAQQLQEK